jgi:antitoxin VapB
MSLQLPNEVEQLARLIAVKTGTTPEAIVREAIEASARQAGIDTAQRRRPFDEARVRAIIARVSALPVLDERSADEIIGYNDIGVPE